MTVNTGEHEQGLSTFSCDSVCLVFGKDIFDAMDMMGMLSVT